MCLPGLRSGFLGEPGPGDQFVGTGLPSDLPRARGRGRYVKRRTRTRAPKKAIRVEDWDRVTESIEMMLGPLFLRLTRIDTCYRLI